MIYSKSKKFLPEPDGLNYTRSVVAELSLWAGLFSIITGILGFLSITYGKIHYTCSFVVLSFIIGVLLIVAGSLNA